MTLGNTNNAVQVTATLATVESADEILQQGHQYFNGDGVVANKTGAAELYKRAAEMGSSVAMRQYAWCLETGNGVPKSMAEAVDWYEKAAALGDILAMVSFGEALFKGTGTNPNKKKSLEVLELAASKGANYAKMRLAQWFYLSGIVVEKDIVRAQSLVREVAEQEKNKDAREQARMFLQAMSAANLSFWRRGFRHTYSYQQGVYSTVSGGIAGGGTAFGRRWCTSNPGRRRCYDVS